MSAALPWEIDPALSQPRLVVLARIVAETRNKVFAEADREAGDTNWGLGCRAHERLGHALSCLAETGKHPWLTVTREGLYLMPLVDGVPIRPYRGAADRPGSRHLDALRAEASRAQPRQITFDFMGPEADGPWFWLLALETDMRGIVQRAVYFQANEAGQTRNAWACPLDAPVEEQPVAPPERKRAAPARGATRALRAIPAAPLLSPSFDFTAPQAHAAEAPALQAV